MFTGLVQAVGCVAAISPIPQGGVRLLVDPRGWDHRPALGDSIAVSGVCLTLAAPLEAQGGRFAFDVVAETLRITTLRDLIVGASVNLERSLAAFDLLGGHLVQGHVDGVGTVEKVESSAEYRVRIRVPEPLRPFLAPKGSITLDGVSLTVAAVDPSAGTFDVALIPTTLQKTTLAALRPGDRCNLESDIIARTVVHYLRHFGGAPGGTASAH